MDLFFNIGTAFILGVLTPLTAVCVLPLFPGFLSYLANQLGTQETNKAQILKLGLLVSLGVILFMMLLGLLFTTLLQVSLTQVIGIISPIAFGILLLISLLLIFDLDVTKFIPHIEAPQSKNPHKNAFFFGFFFGAIVLPCNPLFIAALFTRSITITDFITNFLSFIAFGIGISAPLLVLSVLSLANSRKVTQALVKYKRWINVISGILMFVISAYYLLFIFRIVPFL